MHVCICFCNQIKQLLASSQAQCDLMTSNSVVSVTSSQLVAATETYFIVAFGEKGKVDRNWRSEILKHIT